MLKKVLWPRFSNEIIAFTSTRQGGFSNPPFAALNLAFHVGDDVKIVRKNRAKLFGEFNFNHDNTVIVKQFHSDIVDYVTDKQAGLGYDSFDSGVAADALYTDTKGLALGIYHADCVPVFIYVPSIKVVAIIHAGEEGTLQEITHKTVEKIIEKYGVEGQDVFAYLGPSLKFGHRRISKDHASELLKLYPNIAYGIKGVEPEFLLDLPFINFMQLRNLGIPSINIDMFEDCTYENADDFFSYARETSTGRMMSFIALKD